MVQVRIDGRVGQFGDVVALPVAADALREDRVERAVEPRVGHRGDHLANARREVAERRHRRVTGLNRPGEVHHRDRERVAVPVLGHEGQRRRDLERREPTVGLRGIFDPFAPEAQQVARVVEFVEEQTDSDGVDRMQLELEGRHHTEVAAAAADRPEQVVVLGLAGPHRPAISGDHIGREQVVDAQPVTAGQVADAAAQGETRNTGGRHDPTSGRQPVRVGRIVEVAPGRAAARPRRACRRIDVHMPHQRQVDDQTVIVAAEPRRAVPPTADREIQPVLPGEIHRAHHVRGLLGADHRPRPPVEHAVVHRAGLVVASVIRRDHRTAQFLPQLIDSHRPAPVPSPPCQTPSTPRQPQSIDAPDRSVITSSGIPGTRPRAVATPQEYRHL